MSTNTYEKTMEKQQVQTTGSTATDSSTRSAFAHQTGQVLVTLGTLFKHVPPFNETIDKSTGETLISIGKKLKSTK
ncbi:MAG TPA: hypothetical protein PLF42_03205 [Anaerolineales bacterium]|nr:hypothetical protein [Anaerolineales bacterium]